MKHAYLILAHNQFEVLNYLIASLDDSRNHIFIHFDKKVSNIPELVVSKAMLTCLADKVDVRWGDISVIEAEFALFEEAFKVGGFSYYHLLSGVDMPLKSQNYIHNFFQENNGKEFIGFYQGFQERELIRKVKKVHLFSKDFRHDGTFVSLMKKIVRAAYLRFQLFFAFSRNNTTNFKKGTQWVSVTPRIIELAIKSKAEILHIYRNTFCSDEIFLQTLCWNSSLQHKIFNKSNEARGCMRMISWKDGEMLEWNSADYMQLINSDFLFARKFSADEISLVDKIYQYVTLKDE